MTQVAPFLTFREWKGSDVERFRFAEQNRIQANLKRLADMVGVSFQPTEITHADQFSTSLQNRIEETIEQICAKLGIEAQMETTWDVRRGLTYRDFDRVENWLYEAYKALNGEGGRIEWDEERNFDPYALYADNWTGTGPYYYDLPTDLGMEYNDGLIWVRPSATVAQRTAEYNAMITVVSSAEGVRLCANGIRPHEDIPIIITRGLSPMHESATLQASKWTGSGPWTQSIVMANPVAVGVITVSENTTTAQATAFAKAGISVSGVSGTTVTVRAILSKPTVDLPVLLIYESSEGSK